MTHPREYSDEEMKEMAKSIDDEDAAFFGTSQAHYKLYNTAQCAVFYFENRESDKTLYTRFELAMENLYIQGEQDGATEFSIELPPGQHCFKMLKPIEAGEATSI